jgi:hypothetical protein
MFFHVKLGGFEILNCIRYGPDTYNVLGHVNMDRDFSDRGRIGVFYESKMPKTHWR